MIEKKVALQDLKVHSYARKSSACSKVVHQRLAWNLGEENSGVCNFASSWLLKLNGLGFRLLLAWVGTVQT